MIDFKFSIFGRTFTGFWAVFLGLCWGCIIGWVAGYIFSKLLDVVIARVTATAKKEDEEGNGNGEDANGGSGDNDDEETNGEDDNGGNGGNGSAGFTDPGPNGDDDWRVMWDVSPAGVDLALLGRGTGQPLRAAARKPPVRGREGGRMSALTAGFGTVLEAPGVSPPNQRTATTKDSQGSLT